jgi:5-hydroxyisourate hydrolase-like protein (transthyretin family)
MVSLFPAGSLRYPLRVPSLGHLALYVLLALALLMVTPVSAQIRTGDAGAGGVVVAGRVVDAVTGSPLSKAEVQLSAGAQPGAGPQGLISTRTAADGNFRFDQIAAGDYVFTVRHRAYSACGAEVRGLGSRQQNCVVRLSLRPGQRADNAEIRLLPSAVITGTVTDEDGDPMPGVVVEAEQYRYVRGTKVLTASGRATTDDRGQYRMYNLTPGRYYLKAQRRGIIARLAGALNMGGGPGGRGMGGMMFDSSVRISENEGAISYATIYYPSGDSIEEAIPLQLAPGTEMTGMDFRMVPQPAYTVRGVVQGFDPAQPVGMGVSARRAGSGAGFGGVLAVTNADGRTGAFQLQGLTPGRYELVGRTAGGRRGNNAASYSGVAVIDIHDGPLDGVVVPLRPDPVLPGEIRTPSDAQLDLSRIRVVVEQAMRGPQFQNRVDADGFFQVSFSAADPPNFRLEGLPEGAYVRSMNLSGVDLLAPGAQPPSDPSGSLIIDLATDGARVSGIARDASGKPATDARVVLMPTRDGHAKQVWGKTVLSMEDGSFQLADVAPGTYRLYVFEQLDSGPALDPEFLSLFGQRYKEVQLRAGDMPTVEDAWVPASETSMHLGEMAP